MIDTDLDAALREVIFNTAAAARAEGFHVQVALGERVSACLCAIAPSIHIIAVVPGAGCQVSRHDLFHGHFFRRKNGEVGILLHACEYPCRSRC